MSEELIGPVKPTLEVVEPQTVEQRVEQLEDNQAELIRALKVLLRNEPEPAVIEAAPRFGWSTILLPETPEEMIYAAAAMLFATAFVLYLRVIR